MFQLNSKCPAIASFDDNNGMALRSKLIGGGKPCRSRGDNGNLLPGSRGWLDRPDPAFVEGPVDYTELRTEFIGLIYEGLLDAIAGLKIVIANLVENRTDILQSFYVTNADAVAIGVLMLVIGAAIGMLGSAIGLRRFLEA